VSIKMMTVCWDHSNARGTDLLVLLALADIADDNGECWPSIAHLARKVRLDTRTTQRRIRSLEDLGEVVVIRGGGRSSSAGGVKSNRYKIVVHIPDEGDGDRGESPGVANRHPGTDAGGRVAPVPPLTLAPVPPEPSMEPSIEPSLSLESDLWKSIHEVTGPDKSDIANVERLLRAKGATPDDVYQKAPAITRHWSSRELLTPRSLLKHWDAANVDVGTSVTPSPRNRQNDQEGARQLGRRLAGLGTSEEAARRQLGAWGIVDDDLLAEAMSAFYGITDDTGVGAA
jgi:hypothetical protein